MNLRKSLMTLKVVVLLLVLGLAVTAYSSSPAGLTSEYQQVTVTGTVTDASTGEAMTGVNILVKGTSYGSITDVAGKYSVTAPDRNATLVFSFIGYYSLEVPLSGRVIVDVSLTEELTGLDEVVVVGYGTQKRANVIGAVTSLPGQSIVSIPAANVSNAISGRLAGAIVIQNSGEPGQQSARILVRGRSNIGGSTSPLVIIDGIAGRSMDDIDPNDISSLSVLKDASASIYGATAANGVVLITTKRGQEGKPKLNYQFYQGFMTPTVIPEVCNAGDYATMLTEYQVNQGRPRSFTDADIALFYSGEDPWRHPDTDWIGDLIKTWTTNYKHSLSLDGGYKGMTYYISLGLKGDDAIYEQSSTKYKQYNVRAKVDLPITDWLKTSIDIAGFQIDKLYPTKGAGDIWGQSTRLVPTQWSFWPNGLPGPDIEYGDNPVVTSTFQTGKDDHKTYTLQSGFSATITPPFIKGLSIGGSFNYDMTHFYRKRFVQPWILYYPNWANATIDPVTGFVTDMPVIPTPRGVSYPQNNEYYQRTIQKTGNLNLSYTRLFGEHNIGLYAGFEQYTYDYNDIWAYRTYYISPAVQIMNAGADLDKNNSGSVSIGARKSYWARATYGYKDRYLAEFVFRRDGSLKYSQERRWGNFPGVMVGWRVSEEDFWKNNIPFVNYLKLRGSYGVMGLESGNAFQYLNTYNLSTGMTLGTSKVIETTVIPGTVANPDITWEEQITRNVGFDSRFLNDMFNLNFEYFFNIRDNILVYPDASVPSFTGLSLPQQNIGKVKNNGFEIEAGFHKTFVNELRLDVNANFSRAHNEVTEMDEPARAVDWQVRTGHPYGTTIMYNAIGIFADNTFTVNGVPNYPHWSNAKPGDVIFEDVSGDGAITTDDMILVDFTDAPEIFYGASVDASWKNFTLTVLVQGQGKYLRFNHYDERRGEAGNYYQWTFDNRWTPTNTNTDIARAFNRNDLYWAHALRMSTYWYDNTAYCRLKNVVLTYNIPKKIYSRLGVANASIYFSGNNLALIYTATKKFDPEIGSAGTYPALKTFAIGANVTF